MSERPDDQARDEEQPVDTVEVRGPLRVEKLEGRDETGRDAQDEAEQDVVQED